MSFDLLMQIVETKEWGVVLSGLDVETADQFEDFLSEMCFVFFNIKFEEDMASFFFGQAAGVNQVKSLYDRFIAERMENNSSK